MKSLNYLTITNTIRELTKAGKIEISNNLSDILHNNELKKTEKHNKKDDLKTSFYKIELEENVVEEIIDLLLDLEVESLTENGDASELTNYYVNLINHWSK
jgi:hypothetical protein